MFTCLGLSPPFCTTCNRKDQAFLMMNYSKKCPLLAMTSSFHAEIISQFEPYKSIMEFHKLESRLDRLYLREDVLPSPPRPSLTRLSRHIYARLSTLLDLAADLELNRRIRPPFATKSAKLSYPPSHFRMPEIIPRLKLRLSLPLNRHPPHHPRHHPRPAPPPCAQTVSIQ